MTIIRKLLGLGQRPVADNPPAAKEPVASKPDQLSVDVAIASQQNNQAAIQVRETLSQMLASADAVRLAKR